MTIAAGKTPYHRYAPGAAMSAEAIPFEFIDPAHLSVRLVDGAALVEGVDYAIAGDWRTGAATITALAEVDGGVYWELFSTTPDEQQLKLAESRVIPLDQYERELDRGAIRDREMRRDIDRTPKVPFGETIGTLPPADQRKGILPGATSAHAYAAYDANGNPTVDTPENFAAPAQSAAERAESAADIAEGTRKYYATVAEGMAATADPDVFTSDENGTLTWYDANGNALGEPLTRAMAGIYTRASLKAQIAATAYSATQDLIISRGFDTAEIGVGIWHRFDLGTIPLNDDYVALYPHCTAKSADGSYFRYVPSSAGLWAPAVGLVPNSGVDMTAIWDEVMAYMQARKFFKIALPVGTIILGDATVFDQLQIKGEAWSSYTFNIDKTRTTTLQRRVDAASAIDLRGKRRVHLEDFDIDGNGGHDANFGDGLIDTGDKGSFSYSRFKVYNCHQGVRGNAFAPGSAGGDMAVIRQCNFGALNWIDSRFSQVTFSGNRVAALKINGRQCQVMGCFIEWNRTNTTEAANGIVLDVNADETLIADCHFDHNAGYDIVLLGNGGKGAKNTEIIGNKMSGAGWGTDVTNQNSASIYSQGPLVSGVLVKGNVFVQRDVEPGTTPGNRSPLRALQGTVSGLIWKGNDTRELDQPLNLTAKRTWVQSPANANEYYLTFTGRSQVWIFQPSVIEHNGTLLVLGTAGALALGEFAWADNDGLGYSTVYVRLTGDVAPSAEAVYALYSNDPVPVSGTDVQTDAYRDRWFGTIAGGAAQEVTLQTRIRVPDIYRTERVMLRVFGRNAVSNARASYLVPVILTRLGNLQAFATPGAVVAELAGFTVGTAGANLNLAVSARRVGSAIKLTLTNTLADALDITVEVAW